MNIAQTRSEMLACVTALQEKFATVTDPVKRSRLAQLTKRKIERIKKRFKHKIDERVRHGFGFAIHEREGIERELAKATASVLALVEKVVG